ncbi:hypothetical protein I4U23_022061 [Adineta vaga]|nr:hypothetical protein I4U23_022061 [Adineta vaga]
MSNTINNSTPEKFSQEAVRVDLSGPRVNGQPSIIRRWILLPKQCGCLMATAIIILVATLLARMRTFVDPHRYPQDEKQRTTGLTEEEDTRLDYVIEILNFLLSKMIDAVLDMTYERERRVRNTL